MSRLARAALLLFVLAAASAAALGMRRTAPVLDPVTLSVIGTTDLHGFVAGPTGRGGLALLGGYVRNLRSARAADGGAVLLLDAGDTYQGGIESNLSEGAVVVDAFNALGYTAAAIGNHEFDFGPVDVDGRRLSADADPQGALKAIAARARFPLLAANLLDETTGMPVSWPNVRPSVMVEAAGIKVGIVGVMTIDALQKTLVVNTRGLRVGPLVPAIADEASRLRAAGAHVVVATAHAGGRCRDFTSPADLSSCDEQSEIFQVARELPRGLVDAIVAGHAHAGVAHVVNGIPISESYSHGRAFGRIDLSVDRTTGSVVAARVFAPQDLCAPEDAAGSGCTPSGASGTLVPAAYEGQPVTPDRAVEDAMAPALQAVRALQATPLGAYAETPIPRFAGDESPLGNLFADALRASQPGADAAIVNGGPWGGLRADLPRGLVTFGRLYDMFPFDNQVARLRVSGSQLLDVLDRAGRRARPMALGVSGIRVARRCDSAGRRIEVRRSSGAPIDDDETLVVITTEMLANAFFDRATERAFIPSYAAPVAREVVADWLGGRGGRLSASDFASHPPGSARSGLPCPSH